MLFNRIITYPQGQRETKNRENASVNKEEQVKLAKELNNSQPLDVHTWSDYSEVNKAVDYLYEEFKALPEFKGKQNIQKKHIKVVLLDLYVTYLADPERYIAYHRMKGKYKEKNRYNQLHPKLSDLLF